jgi:hypothetical protein
MIEKVIKAKKKTFRYGEVVSYNAVKQTATVKIGEKTVAVSAPMTLTVGGMMIAAQNDQDKSWLIVEAGSSRIMPPQKTLIAL